MAAIADKSVTGSTPQKKKKKSEETALGFGRSTVDWDCPSPSGASDFAGLGRGLSGLCCRKRQLWI